MEETLERYAMGNGLFKAAMSSVRVGGNIYILPVDDAIYRYRTLATKSGCRVEEGLEVLFPSVFSAQTG